MEFKGLIGEDAYSAYLRVKRDEHELNNVSYDSANKILKLSEKWLKELKKL